MSINFATLQGLTIPEGVVTQITDASGRVLWMLANDEPAILEVAKQTITTYAGETSYTGESVVLLDIYPKSANSTVKVTYGNLTKTLTFSGTNAQQVFFGTFNGVSDSVKTPESGTLIIEGGFDSFTIGSYTESSDNKGNTTIKKYTGVTSILSTGSASSIRNFANCTGLTNVAISKSVTSIDANAFDGCNSITAFSIDVGNKHYSSDGYVLFDKNETTLIKCIVGVTQYSVPDGVTTINANAFSVCSSLESVTLPNTLTDIGNKAFTQIYNLPEIPEGVKTIGAYAFYGEDMQVAKSESFTLPSTIESVGDYAFSTYYYNSDHASTDYYSRMTNLIMLATTPPVCGEGAFGTSSYPTIIVPMGCGEAYKAAWTEYSYGIEEAS